LNDLIKNIRKIIIVLAVFSLPFLNGCKNELTDEGIGYISSDTLGTLLLDSYVDSVNITSNSFIKYINSTYSKSMFVGKYGDYESKILLKFKNIPSNYDSSDIISANLNLRYNKTFYRDSTGITSFNIYKLNSSYDLTTITYDKFNSSDIGTTVLGTFTGSLTDTSKFSIPLDITTVKSWFKYAYDTNYAVKNYGLAFVPNASSNSIKGLFSANYSDSLVVPVVTVVFQNPQGRIDTVNLKYSDFTSLNYVPQVNNAPGRITIQNGVAIKNKILFNLSKLPGKVIINQALLELKIDWANSYLSPGVVKNYVGYMLTSDTLTIDDQHPYISTAKEGDSSIHVINFTYALQSWNYGLSSNIGLLLQNYAEYTNLDRFAYYGPDYPDASLRPRLKIRYTIRR